MVDDEPSRALGFPRRREENTVSLADELAYITVVELAGRIRRREVSPVEVLEATIKCIEANIDARALRSRVLGVPR